MLRASLDIVASVNFVASVNISQTALRYACANTDSKVTKAEQAVFTGKGAQGKEHKQQKQ
jgi:hypothetical protein